MSIATLSSVSLPQDDLDTQALTSPPIIPLEPADYNASCVKYEKLADLKLRNSDTIVLGGYGCFIKVVNGALSVEYERSHVEGNKKLLKWNRGTHKIKQLIICAHGGYITLDAIEWLCQQNITAYIMNWKGEFLQTFSPRQNRSAKLAYLQYRAMEDGQDREIVREIIRVKIEQQLATLRKLPAHRLTLDSEFRDMRIIAKRAKTNIIDLEKQFIDALSQLKVAHDIDTIRMLEAHAAVTYWHAFIGLSIHWKGPDGKRIPQDWHKISERGSNLSPYSNAKYATNPFHAALNFAYALLKAQVLQAINVAGLSPEVGYLHVDSDGSNLLVYDLIECFRPIVDQLVLDLFQKTKFSKGDFIQWFTGEARLNEELRRYILASCRVSNVEIDKLCRWLRNTLESPVS